MTMRMCFRAGAALAWGSPFLCAEGRGQMAVLAGASREEGVCRCEIQDRCGRQGWGQVGLELAGSGHSGTSRFQVWGCWAPLLCPAV